MEMRNLAKFKKGLTVVIIKGYALKKYFYCWIDNTIKIS